MSKGWLVPLVTFSSHVVETIWVTEVRGVEGVDPLDCFGPEAPGRGEIGYLKVHAKSLGGPIVLKEAAIHPKFTCRENFHRKRGREFSIFLPRIKVLIVALEFWYIVDLLLADMETCVLLMLLYHKGLFKCQVTYLFGPKPIHRLRTVLSTRRGWAGGVGRSVVMDFSVGLMEEGGSGAVIQRLQGGESQGQGEKSGDTDWGGSVLNRV